MMNILTWPGKVVAIISLNFILHLIQMTILPN